MHMYMYMHACMYVCISTCLFTWRFGILSKSKQTRLYFIKVIIRESILIAFWISANKIMFGQIVILFLVLYVCMYVCQCLWVMRKQLR